MNEEEKKTQEEIMPTSFTIVIHADIHDGIEAVVVGKNAPYNAIQFALSQTQQKFRQDEIEVAMAFARKETSEE